MKILHVLNSQTFSGAENVVCQIINMFRNERNYTMAYCSPDGNIRDILLSRNINFIPVFNMNIAEIQRVICQYKPDVLHAHDMKAGFVVARSCAAIPLISHIHNNAFDSRRISLKSIAYYFAARKAKKIIWVSHSSYEGYVFHHCFKDKSLVLYNVINQKELRERMNQDRHHYNYDVVYIGRFTYPKNPQRFLQILKIVCDKLPNLKVAVIGTGELEQEMKGLCNQLKLSNNVFFLGFQKNPLKILHDSKVMVMTSRWEGTPMVALEAMTLGVPIVSTPTDGMNELIIQGVNGYLTDDNNTLAKYIIELVSNIHLYQKISAGQLSRAEKVNNTERYKSTLCEVYEQ